MQLKAENLGFGYRKDEWIFRNKDFEIILVLRYRHKRKILSVDSNNVFKKIKIYSSLDDAINYTQKYELKNNG